jgi:hypothetical protein
MAKFLNTSATNDYLEELIKASSAHAGSIPVTAYLMH